MLKWVRFAWTAAACLVVPLWVEASSGFEDEVLVIRLEHPERQADAWLRLFQGTRAPDPASALTAWKRATRDPGRLGKPLEAVIAGFNPEMVTEWRLLHAAELHAGYRGIDGKLEWYAVIPHDDGAIAAGITAKRVTDGTDEAPLVHSGKQLIVSRLGQPHAPVASDVGSAVVAASSRELLGCALDRLQAITQAAGAPSAPAAEANAGGGPRQAGPAGAKDSGVLLQLDAARLVLPAAGPLALRRGVELMRGLGCRQITGKTALSGDRLALEVTTKLGDEHPAGHPAPVLRAIEPAWLEEISCEHVMAAISVACEGQPEFWDKAFALADRVERADPARAGLAPLRLRFHVVATAAGARPEADLWPHLRGVTVCLLGDAGRPGEPSGALVGLHVDTPSSAERLASEFLPRLWKGWVGRQQTAKPHDMADGKPAGAQSNPSAARLGTPGGRALELCRRGQTVWVAWGDGALAATLKAPGKKPHSLGELCTNWGKAARGAPNRLGAIWPARCWFPVRPRQADEPAGAVLAADPPVVWWGWTNSASAVDLICWSGLHDRVSRFLDEIPLQAPAVP
jgi:hypothetical protein